MNNESKFVDHIMMEKYGLAIELSGIMKETPKLEWVANQVENPESVAEHSMRTAFLAMILTPPEVNKAKAVQMALIHDVANSTICDFSPFDGATAEERYKKENGAWTKISKSLNSTEMQDLWNEMEANETSEAMFVNQLDRLETLIQAEEYEVKQNIDLSHIFRDFRDFFTFEATNQVYDAICKRRQSRLCK